MTISGKTRVTGLFGYPVAHSLSPAMHNAAYRALGLDFVYVPFQVTPPNLPSAVCALRALDIAGVNVTVPHKETVIPYLDCLDQSALRCGAVNTIVNSHGTLTGYNTDGPGFTDALREEGLSASGLKAVVLGAGGTARAVVSQLLAEGAAQIIIINRTVEKALALAVALGAQDRVQVYGLGDKAPLAGAGLVVNTLSVPFRQEGGWLVDLSPAAGALFFDLRYGAMPPDFRHYARELESPSVDGLGMLLYQGARAFELFTGHKAPVDVMKKALQHGDGSFAS